jgi:pSer/pThr/pTyr-binding forkhead associated (FHA) protein
MYLEVHVEPLEPVVYILNKDEIYVGSSTGNDVVISSGEVSRKHLKFIFQQEKVLVRDLGSTNGTYLEDEQLIPGKSYDIALDAPLRLGTKIHLTLSKKKKALPTKASTDPTERTTTFKTNEDKTRVISLRELEAAKRRKLKTRQAKLTKRAAQEKKKKIAQEKYNKLVYRVGLYLVLALGLHFYLQKRWSREADPFASHKKVALNERAIELGEDEVAIDRSRIITREEVLDAVMAPKCQQPEEAALCRRLNLSVDRREGVILRDDKYLVFIENPAWLARISSRINEFPEEQKVTDLDLISRLAVLEFITTTLRPAIPVSLGDRYFYVVSFPRGEGTPQVMVARTGFLLRVSRRYERWIRAPMKDTPKLFSDLRRFLYMYEE